MGSRLEHERDKSGQRPEREVSRRGTFRTNLEGKRKLIVFVIAAVLMMVAGYTMPDASGNVIMGIAGVTTAFMGGNLIEHRMNRNRFNNYNQHGHNFEETPYD